MKKLLFPFTFIYSLGVFLDKLSKRPQSLGKCVISVGNITWGGTGKTPVVIELVKYIQSLGKAPVVLTRGYNRSKHSKTPVLLSKQNNSSVSLAGDEPMLIHKSTSAPVVIGANRVAGADYAQGKIETDVFILDDGFQHWRIKRDLDIVCVNALNPFGNGMLIPAGILREKKTALKRAGLVIITNSNLVGKEVLEKLSNEILNITGESPIVSHYGNYSVTGLNLKDAFEISSDSKVRLICGLGFAKGFADSVEKAGLKIAGITNFKDHHNYVLSDIESLIRNNEVIVTTAKDAVKIDELLARESPLRNRIAVLNINVIFDKGEDLWKQKIERALSKINGENIK